MSLYDGTSRRLSHPSKRNGLLGCAEHEVTLTSIACVRAEKSDDGGSHVSSSVKYYSSGRWDRPDCVEALRGTQFLAAAKAHIFADGASSRKHRMGAKGCRHPPIRASSCFAGGSGVGVKLDRRVNEDRTPEGLLYVTGT